MRVAKLSDLQALNAVYTEALAHANKVGFIDWPNPFTPANLRELIATKELFCFEEKSHVVAAAKIATHPDKRIWDEVNEAALYIGKVATGDHVRGADFFRKHMLPAIQGYAPELPVRLDCLADNEHLRSFYERAGFEFIRIARFFSDKQQQTIAVALYQLPRASGRGTSRSPRPRGWDRWR